VRTFKLFFYGLLVLLFVIFVIQNYSTLTYSVSLRLNLGILALESVPLPFFVIAPIIFFAGLLLATVIGWVERRRLSKELKQLKSGLREPEPKMAPHEEASATFSPPSETGNLSSKTKTSIPS
jgi:uncharacterized integral membrane protein